MSEYDNKIKIIRMIFLLEQVWLRYPNLQLGQVLEILAAQEAKVMLIARRKNFKFSHADVEVLGRALGEVSDEEFEQRLTKVLNGSGKL